MKKSINNWKKEVRNKLKHYGIANLALFEAVIVESVEETIKKVELYYSNEKILNGGKAYLDKEIYNALNSTLHKLNDELCSNLAINSEVAAAATALCVGILAPYTEYKIDMELFDGKYLVGYKIGNKKGEGK